MKYINFRSESKEDIIDKPKVFLGAPVRNRAWILPRYIEGINRQGIPMETLFIVNDCDDNTKQILVENGFRVFVKNFGKASGHLRGEYSKGNLAELRNILLEEFLKSKCEYLLSVDTDIILPDNSINQLIDNDKDIVSMLIKNSDVINAHNIFIEGKHVEQVPEGLIPVDMTGAVYLIKRKVIESGVRYAYHKLGEDITFCNSAKEKGYEIFCDTRLKPVHVFKENLDLIAKTINFVPSINVDMNTKKQIFLLLETCQQALDYIIKYLQEEEFDKVIDFIDNLIKAFNKIGETLEVFKTRKSYYILEERFNKINKTIGLIIRSLELNDTNETMDMIKNHLRSDVLNWKNELDNFL